MLGPHRPGGGDWQDNLDGSNSDTDADACAHDFVGTGQAMYHRGIDYDQLKCTRCGETKLEGFAYVPRNRGSNRKTESEAEPTTYGEVFIVSATILTIALLVAFTTYKVLEMSGGNYQAAGDAPLYARDLGVLCFNGILFLMGLLVFPMAAITGLIFLLVFLGTALSWLLGKLVGFMSS